MSLDIFATPKTHKRKISDEFIFCRVPALLFSVFYLLTYSFKETSKKKRELRETGGPDITLLEMLRFFGFLPLLKSEITPKNGNLHLILKIR